MCSQHSFLGIGRRSRGRVREDISESGGKGVEGQGNNTGKAQRRDKTKTKELNTNINIMRALREQRPLEKEGW